MKETQRGLTLTELLVSIGLFSILMLAIMPSLLLNQRVNQGSKDAQNIATYARSTLDIAAQALLSPSTGTADRYPNLTSGTIPTGTTYPSLPAGITCTTPAVSNVVKLDPGAATSVGSRATLSMSCTPSKGTQVDFVRVVVRPS